jgi:hypothetical protein
MPVVQSIKVYRGEDITLSFTMVPSRDITGWVISLTIAKNYNNPNKLIQVTGTVTSGPNGTFDVILTSAQLDIEPGTYVYDVFRTDPGNLRILSVGEFIITADAREP